jgi:hypothetical protein
MRRNPAGADGFRRRAAVARPKSPAHQALCVKRVPCTGTPRRHSNKEAAALLRHAPCYAALRHAPQSSLCEKQARRDGLADQESGRFGLQLHTRSSKGDSGPIRQTDRLGAAYADLAHLRTTRNRSGEDVAVPRHILGDISGTPRTGDSRNLSSYGDRRTLACQITHDKIPPTMKSTLCETFLMRPLRRVNKISQDTFACLDASLSVK